jgi:hypothetical protein
MPYKYETGIRRDEFLLFAKLGEAVGYKILGFGVEDLSLDLEADEVERKCIVNKDPITDVRSMSKSGSVEMIAYKDDPIYEAVFEAYRKQESIKGKALSVYNWTDTAPKADEQDILIVPTSFGGGEDLAISYDIKFNGSPVAGTATLEEATQSATFTADGE